MLTRPDEWVWDTWFADDGERFHAFHLHAPTSLGDQARRHRAARIGHATSPDLVEWELLPDPIAPGATGEFDATATWTGSVVRSDDGRWLLFYTGARFLRPEPEYRNVQTIGAAVSDDLMTWTKLPGPLVEPDPRWYETLDTADWYEQAWRDPYVFRDPHGHGWHMLVTARANTGAPDDRGVLGHAVSGDLVTWQVVEPLSAPGAGFGHLEVPQVVDVDGRWVLLFSAPYVALSAAHAARVTQGGTWGLVVDDPIRPFDVSSARLVLAEDRYSAHLERDREGRWVLMAFRNEAPGIPLRGDLTDPIPVRFDATGLPLPDETRSGDETPPATRPGPSIAVRTGPGSGPK